MNKEQALKRLDELEAKVDEKVASEKALRLGAEKEVDDLRIEVKQFMSANQDLAKLADKYKLQNDDLQHKLDGYGDLARALGKIRGDSPAVDVDAIVAKVLEKIPKGSGPGGFVPVPPREALLKSFMKDEVDRLEERIKSLPPDVRRVVAYLQARGTNSSKSDLITHVWGPGFTGGERYKDVSGIIDDAVTTGLVRKDSAGRHYSNVQLKVETDLKPYEAAKEEIQGVVDRVVYYLAQGAVRTEGAEAVLEK